MTALLAADATRLDANPVDYSLLVVYFALVKFVGGALRWAGLLQTPEEASTPPIAETAEVAAEELRGEGHVTSCASHATRRRSPRICGASGPSRIGTRAGSSSASRRAPSSSRPRRPSRPSAG